MYAHLVDVFTKTIIIRNDNDMSIQISRNFRLKKVFELKYFNVFYVFNEKNNVHELTMKQSIFVHKKKDLRKS